MTSKAKVDETDNGFNISDLKQSMSWPCNGAWTNGWEFSSL